MVLAKLSIPTQMNELGLVAYPICKNQLKMCLGWDVGWAGGGGWGGFVCLPKGGGHVGGAGEPSCGETKPGIPDTAHGARGVPERAPRGWSAGWDRRVSMSKGENR